MIVKKHKNKNEYCLASGLWIRDFRKNHIKPVDINQLFTPEDMRLMISNELSNSKGTIQQIETENFEYENIAIISDGYKFKEEHFLVELLPKNVILIGVNRTLCKWESQNRRMNYYVINNPYEEALNLLPKNQKLLPRCIASLRTNPEFIKKYNGMMYLYHPVSNQEYTGVPPETEYLVDDYRNPICASISLAFKFKVKKLLLFFPDEVYEHNRPGMEKITDNKWMYPQQIVAHNIIDAHLHWLRESKVNIGIYSKGPEYVNGTYIEMNELRSFFDG